MAKRKRKYQIVRRCEKCHQLKYIQDFYKTAARIPLGNTCVVCASKHRQHMPDYEVFQAGGAWMIDITPREEKYLVGLGQER